MRTTLKWFGVGLLVTAVAIALGLGLQKKMQHDSARAAFEARPLRERNLAVFDAACTLLEQHYYNREYFKTESWQKAKAVWRAKADSDEQWLYPNVLDNLARSFPESHVAFTAPPLSAAGAATAVKLPPKKIDPATVAAREAAFARQVAAFNSGPGFLTGKVYRQGGTFDLVAEVLRGSPAERAGVTPGWIVKGFNLNVTTEHAHYQATFISLTPGESQDLQADGKLPGVTTPEQLQAFIKARTVPVEFDLEQLPPQADFETRTLPGAITYVRFDRFESLDLVEKTIGAIDSAGAGGLILDLRRNPGGRGFHMSRVAGALLGGGVRIGATHDANSTADFPTLRLTNHYQGPVVVLIGPLTASAAEITAAAVQDLGRGKLVGRATSGAVLVGNKFTLPDGGEMMVPVSDFRRVDGRRIEGIGVQPDVWVIPTLEDVRAGRDPVIDKALELLGATSKQARTSDRSFPKREPGSPAG